MTRTRTPAALLARDHDVRGLDVAVDDAARVAVLEGVGDLDRRCRRPRRGAATASRIRRSRFVPLDERHDEEERALVPAEVVDRHDGRVVHLGDELRLALEALLDLGRQVASRR